MNYTFDSKTGGIILNSMNRFQLFDFNDNLFNVDFDKIRPVFYEEMELLNFNKYFDYGFSEVPFMWFRRGKYIYRGEHIATLKKIEDMMKFEIIKEKDVDKLLPIDIKAMNEKNKDYIEELEKKSLEVIEKAVAYKDTKYICSFSGGKDSLVILELLSIADIDFDIWFADTQFENKDTYEYIEVIKNHYSKYNFYIAKSHLDKEYLINKCGYPSKYVPWCCSITKKHSYNIKN